MKKFVFLHLSQKDNYKLNNKNKTKMSNINIIKDDKFMKI